MTFLRHAAKSFHNRHRGKKMRGEYKYHAEQPGWPTELSHLPTPRRMTMMLQIDICRNSLALSEVPSTSDQPITIKLMLPRTSRPSGTRMDPSRRVTTRYWSG